MRKIRSTILAVAWLVACAGGDGVGASTQSPFYGPSGGSNSGGDEETGDDGDDDDDDGEAEVESGAASMTGEPGGDVSGEPPAPAEDGGDDGAPPPQPPPPGDCCTPAGVPGCANDPAVEMCVCQIDDFCCTDSWDETCVSIVGECSLACPGFDMPMDAGGSEGGESEGGGGDNDCCFPTFAQGCSDPQIESCVCMIDDFCCMVVWDDLCAEIAFECGC